MLSETTLRLVIALGLFAGLAILEWARPKRAPSAEKNRRWLTNLALAITNSLITRVLANLVVPISAIAAASFAQAHSIGLFNHTHWPIWAEFAAALIAFDFALWFQHWATHQVPALWQLHQVHHADTEIDVTTALRFHPLEIALSMVWKIAVILALGASPGAALAFEIILNAGAMFSHANMALPQSLDRVLRCILVTPDVHHIHHSIAPIEQASNYGFNLSIWDRLFQTYRAEPHIPHGKMTIGLAEYQSTRPSGLRWNLALPFYRPKGLPVNKTP